MDDLRYIDNSHYTTLLRSQPSPHEDESQRQHHVLSNVDHMRKPDLGDGSIAIRPASDISMTPNLPEEPSIRVLPDRTLSAGTTPASTLTLGQLTLDQSSRKRPAGSDVHAPGAPGRTGSPAKFTRKSSGNLRSSPDTPGRSPLSASIIRKLSDPSRPGHALRRVTSPQNLYSKHRNLGQGASPYDSPPPADPLSPTKPTNSLQYARTPSHAIRRRPTGKERTTEDAIADHKEKQAAEYVAGQRQFRSKSEERFSFENGELQPNAGLLPQPESRPISEPQLAAEVKGIYSGLVIVESKCINVINAQNVAMRDTESKGASSTYTGNVEYFQALIALHRTLLQEQHDFFLASQHPSATPGIRKLASRYSMPARMWKHGIHNFLELLRHNLPASLDYMLAFIYLSFQMMALLVETVPSFEETWIECLGDLARYRMAIEEEDLRDREIWTGVARRWYLKAVDKNADVGRLYHHLAILARSHPLQQVSLYGRSLVANQPFPSTRDSIMTLFAPTLARYRENKTRATSLETLYMIIQAAIYTQKLSEDLEDLLLKFLNQLNDYITRVDHRWKEGGACLAIANIAAVLQFGSDKSHLCKMFRAPKDAPIRPASPENEPCDDTDFPSPDDLSSQVIGVRDRKSFEWRLSSGTFLIALQRPTDNNVLPHIHCMLLFFWQLAMSSGSIYTSQYLPLLPLVTFLNTLVSSVRPGNEICKQDFLTPIESLCQPLPEDYALRGQIWSNNYYPLKWFESASSDHDERYMEHDKTTSHLRAQRILWLAVRLAAADPFLRGKGEVQKRQLPWLSFNPDTKYFTAAHDIEL